jgi:hypothetical protein
MYYPKIMGNISVIQEKRVHIEHEQSKTRCKLVHEQLLIQESES